MKATALVSLSCLALLASPPRAQTTTKPVLGKDAWSKQIVWRISTTNGYSPAIHATLLPDGRLSFIGYERPIKAPQFVHQEYRCAMDMVPAPLGQPLPNEIFLTRVPEPIDAAEQLVGSLLTNDDLFCSGHTLLADGTLFTAGGLRVTTDLSNGTFQKYGLKYATAYDGADWVRLPNNMVGIPTGRAAAWRWYPTCTRLPDERVLVTGGFGLVHPQSQYNYSVEVYDPATQGFTLLSADADSPVEILNSDYPHVFALPQPIGAFDVLMFGEPGYPILFSTTDDTNRWLTLPDVRPGADPGSRPDFGASSAMLPLRLTDGEWGYANGSVIQAGGELNSGLPSSFVDVYDPLANAWSQHLDLQTPRRHPSTVALPDGRVLVIAGHDDSGNWGTTRAAYVDPRHGFAVTNGQASSGVVRGYHTVTLLLPDGRVLVGGGQDNVTWTIAEKCHFQYYYPTYMDQPRPLLRAAPAQIGYASAFDIKTSSGPISEVVLIANGSMTHSFDMNMRYVQLAIQGQVDGTVTVLGPADARLAPAGSYMLFALDEHLVPSIAKIVRLQ